MKDIVKRYTNDEVTVVWQPAKCIHSKKCFHALPAVFNPENRPWIQLEGTSSDDITAQVKRCPSGALSIEGDQEKSAAEPVTLSVTKGGPLLLNGAVVITTPDGEHIQKEGMTALCRCGASANKPYCDGSHSKIKFDT